MRRSTPSTCSSADCKRGARLFSLLKQNPGPGDAGRADARHRAAAGRHPGALSRGDGRAARADLFRCAAGRGQARGRARTASIEEARSYEDFLDRLRMFSQEQMFLIGARVLSGTVSAEQAGGAFARLADVAVRALHRRVEETVAENHGRIRGQQTALLALGKLGGREMTATSDLDLIIVYDFDAGASAVRRRAAALRRAVFRAADAAADQRAVVADQLRRALSGRHAAAAVGPLRSGRHQPRRFRELPGNRSLDLGAHGADARARGLGPAGVRRPRRGGDPRRALPQARSGGDGRRRGRDAAGHRQGEGRGRALGSQICRRRADRPGIHRAISATRPRRRAARNSRHLHRARARQGVAAWGCCRRRRPTCCGRRRGSITI